MLLVYKPAIAPPDQIKLELEIRHFPVTLPPPHILISPLCSFPLWAWWTQANRIRHLTKSTSHRKGNSDTHVLLEVSAITSDKDSQNTIHTHKITYLLFKWSASRVTSTALRTNLQVRCPQVFVCANTDPVHTWRIFFMLKTDTCVFLENLAFHLFQTIDNKHQKILTYVYGATVPHMICRSVYVLSIQSQGFLDGSNPGLANGCYMTWWVCDLGLTFKETGLKSCNYFHYSLHLDWHHSLT